MLQIVHDALGFFGAEIEKIQKLYNDKNMNKIGALLLFLMIPFNVKSLGFFQFNNLRTGNSSIGSPMLVRGVPIGTNHLITVKARVNGEYINLNKNGEPFQGTAGLAAPHEGFFTGGVLEVPGSFYANEFRLEIRFRSEAESPVFFEFELSNLAINITPPPAIAEVFKSDIFLDPHRIIAEATMEFPVGATVVEGDLLPVILHYTGFPFRTAGFQGFNEPGDFHVLAGPWLTNMAIGLWAVPLVNNSEIQTNGYKSKEGWYGEDYVVSDSLYANMTGLSHHVYSVHVLPDPRRPFLLFSSSKINGAIIPQLVLRGLIGEKYAVESSSDLKVWKALVQIQGNSSEVPVPLMEGDSAELRFFRVLTLQ